MLSLYYFILIFSFDSFYLSECQVRCEVYFMEKQIISQEEASTFLNKVTQKFPNFIAGIITDKHGFPIASKIPKNFPYKENILALEAVAKKRSFINRSRYVKVKRYLNNGKTVNMLLLLRKPNKYVYAYKQLKQILNSKYNRF